MFLEGLSQTQREVLGRMSKTEPMSAYGLQTSLSTLRAMVRKGVIKDVTPPGAGGMFSPRTHYEFVKL